MLAALQAQRLNLKPVAQPLATSAASAGTAGELPEEEQHRIRRDFFAAGLERWLPLVADLSFPSASLPLPREACAALLAAGEATSAAATGLARDIDEAMAERGWDRVFVKLSTRSPKDAPQILERAAEAFRDRGGPLLPLQERARLLAELVQQQFGVSSGAEAVALLTSSARVREDLEYSLEAPCYEELSLHVVLRRYDGAIPIANEFRGIVWDGSLNALGQYYHPLVFPELEGQRGRIESDLRALHESLQPKLSAAGFTHCIIDFAWLGPGNVRIIEINPFDGVALGCFPGSTGLFRWDDENDRQIITQGPFQFRIREKPLSDAALKLKLNTTWRDIVAPPLRHGRASAISPPVGVA